jgi:hypothetical protein
MRADEKHFMRSVFILAPPSSQPRPHWRQTKIPKGSSSSTRPSPAGDARRKNRTCKSIARRCRDGASTTLDDYFDEEYDVYDGFEDQKDHKVGLAGIKAKYKGHDVSGIVYGPHGRRGKATIVVMFCNAGATAEEWAALTKTQKETKEASESQSSRRKRSRPRSSCVEEIKLPPLKEYRFADGTGSIQLAEGWRTEAQSCMQGFGGERSRRPADPVRLWLHGEHPQLDGECSWRGRREWRTRVGRDPFCEPADALKALAPQISRLSQANGGPAMEVDRVTKIQDLQPMLPNSQFTVVTFGLTKTTADGRKHYQCAAQISVAPVTNEVWSFWANEVIAPDETAKRDIPLMSAMLLSWKTNDQVVARRPTSGSPPATATSKPNKPRTAGW